MRAVRHRIDSLLFSLTVNLQETPRLRKAVGPAGDLLFIRWVLKNHARDGVVRPEGLSKSKKELISACAARVKLAREDLQEMLKPVHVLEKVCPLRSKGGASALREKRGCGVSFDRRVGKPYPKLGNWAMSERKRNLSNRKSSLGEVQP